MNSPPATPPSKGLDVSSFKKAAVSSTKKKSRATPHHSPPPLRQEDLFDDLYLHPRNLQEEPRNFLGTTDANGKYYLEAGDNGHLKEFENSIECDMCMGEKLYLEGQFTEHDILPELYNNPMRR